MRLNEDRRTAYFCGRRDTHYYRGALFIRRIALTSLVYNLWGLGGIGFV